MKRKIEDCDCKAKKDAKNLIKKIEDINKSKSINFSKSKSIYRTIIIRFIKILVYSLGLIVGITGMLPLFLYIIISNNSKKKIKNKKEEHYKKWTVKVSE